MTIGFFLEGGELGYFGGRRKKQMKWQQKGAFWSKTSERAPFEWNAVSSKNFEIKPPPPHTRTLISPFLNQEGCYLSHFIKRQRRGRTVHLSETPVFSLFGERHPAEHITVSAWKQRVLSVDPVTEPEKQITLLNDVQVWVTSCSTLECRL